MRYLFILLILLTAGTAFAQSQMQQQQANPAEQTLSQEWSAYQLAQQHVSTAIVKVVEGWRADREIMAAERKYWSDYVKGLYGEKSQSMMNPRNNVMVDAVSSSIYDGARNVVLNLNSVSDGTGQAGVVILDPATLIPNPGTHLVLWRCSYDVKGGSVNIEWDGSPDKTLIALAGNYARDFSTFGGLSVGSVVAPTGLIRISTVSFVAGSGYSITLEFKKGGPVGPGLGAFLLKLQSRIVTGEDPDLATAPPVNRDVPHLMGEGNLNETLECTMGNWDNQPRTYEFQWLSDGIVAMLGNSSDTYLVTDNDVGHSITCIVTAINAYGRVEAPPSNAVAVAAPVPPTPVTAPINRDVPYLGGNGALGDTLTCTMGNWEGEPTSYAYQFKSDGTTDLGLGTTSNTYVISDVDVGHSITCVVTATNAGGSTTAPPSNAVAVAGPSGTSRSTPRVPLRH